MMINAVIQSSQAAKTYTHTGVATDDYLLLVGGGGGVRLMRLCFTPPPPQLTIDNPHGMATPMHA